MSTPGSGKKYAAFISYRHLSPDQEIAEALHKMLEHNQVRPHSGVPRNIRPVFLDRGELPTLESIDAGIEQALENSECLFVICSPNLPLSRYCMREIEYFKQLHGGSLRRIYTVLVSGEPGESFPALLCSETRMVPGPDGVPTVTQVTMEPLFADVRAPSLKQSLKKLKKTEYLRLAAAYYGCTYDELYKRRTRWYRKIALIAAAGILAVSSVFLLNDHMRQIQYQASRAASCASYAEEKTAQGDELLSLTLCQAGYEAAAASDSQRYETALRSAVAQYDYKRQVLPAAQVMCASFAGERNLELYYSEDGNRLFHRAGSVFQVTDAWTGEVLQQLPVESTFLSPWYNDRYLTIEARYDEAGILQDTAIFYSLDGPEPVAEYPLRPSERQYPSYYLEQLPEPAGLLVLKDGETSLAYLDPELNLLENPSQMTPLSDEERFPVPELPLYVARKSLFSKERVVKNQQHETLFALKTTHGLTAFSEDYAYFACEEGDGIRVYSTQTWESAGSVPRIEGASMGSLYCLGDCGYILSNYMDPIDSSLSIFQLLDWRTGQVLLQSDGYCYLNEPRHCFYVMTPEYVRTISYQEADLARQGRVQAHWDDRILVYGMQFVSLMDLQGRTLFTADCNPEFQVHYSRDLQRILLDLSGKLVCYGGDGTLLWSLEEDVSCPAISPDGALAAWVKPDGRIAVADSSTGVLRHTLEPASPGSSIRQLSLSASGVCAADESGVSFLEHDGSAPRFLGEYTESHFLEDDLVVLQAPCAYVEDFALWDLKEQKELWVPEQNVGKWAYSPASGILAFHGETSGNHGTFEIRLLNCKDGQTLPSLYLTEETVESIRLDSTGRYLSITSGKNTGIYDLSLSRQVLKTVDAPLYCENGNLYSLRIYNTPMYSMPLGDLHTLHSRGEKILTGTAGLRELTEEERGRYAFS